jgi:hypothetical protein
VTKNKKAIGHLRMEKEIDVELIPVYVSEKEFQDKKYLIQNLITKILITTKKVERSPKRQKEPFYAT